MSEIKKFITAFENLKKSYCSSEFCEGNCEECPNNAEIDLHKLIEELKELKK